MKELNKIVYLLIFILSFLILFAVLFFTSTIKLNGSKKVVINVYEKYEEKGYKANFFGTDITNEVKVEGSVDENTLGTYKITYSVRRLIFIFKVQRIVKVVDKEAPVLTLKGENKINICPTSEYEEEGYEVTDNYDKDLSSEVKTTKGDNYIEYSVSDSSGNKTTVRREIIKEDKEAPVLEVPINVYVGVMGNYERKYKVKDNCDSNVKVNVTGDVDLNTPGRYEVVYEAIDSSNNKSTVKQYVNVTKTNNRSGVIYLTFDDGPSSSATPKILDILKKKGVKATFFIINHSTDLDKYIKREYNEGHTVALHSYTHNYKSIYSSEDAYFNDLYKIQNRVKNITGEESKVIRFPGGTSNTVSRSYNKGIMSRLSKSVLKKGFVYYDWNVDSSDAGNARTKDDVYRNVTRGLMPNRSNVVLMHDFEGNYKTVDALEKIIDYGFANGYKFDKIDITTPAVKHNANN